MTNWYGKFEKQANSLSKSLGLSPTDDIYRSVQSFEKQLKDRGDWQKILSVRKSQGVEQAMQLLNETIKGYIAEPEVTCVNVTFEGKSTTGGEWYSFGGHYDFYDLAEEGSSYAREEWLEYNKEDELKEKLNKKIKEEAEGYFETMFISEFRPQIKKLEEQKMKSLLVHMRGESQLHFPFYNKEETKQSISNKYDKLINEKHKLIDDIKDKIQSLDAEDPEGVKEFFLNTFDEEIDLDELEEDISNEIWEEYTEILRDEVISLEEEYSSNITSGGGWCVSQPSRDFEIYLSGGDEFLILRRDGKPRVAIRSQGGQIYEVQGISNSFSNLEGLDFIDLMNAPYFDVDTIMEGISITEGGPSKGWPVERVKKEALVEIFSIDNKSIKDTMSESIFGEDDYEFIHLFVPTTDYLTPLLDEMVQNNYMKSKIGNIIINNIKHNLGEIKLDSKGKFGEEYTWGHEVIELYNMIDGVDPILKEIFGGNEEILDEFFGSLAASDQPRAALVWALKNAYILIDIWGNKVKKYFDKFNMDSNMFTRTKSLWNYVRDKEYLKDNMDEWTPEQYYDVLEYFFSNFMASGVLGYIDLKIINNLWEFGKMVVPPLGHQGLLNYICIYIIKVITSSIDGSPPYETSAILLNTIVHEYGMTLYSEIHKNLLKFEELKNAYKILMTRDIDPNFANEYRKALGIGEDNGGNLSPQGPMVEGLPMAGPANSHLNNTNRIPPVNASRQGLVNSSKNKGWYKR